MISGNVTPVRPDSAAGPTDPRVVCPESMPADEAGSQPDRHHLTSAGSERQRVTSRYSCEALVQNLLAPPSRSFCATSATRSWASPTGRTTWTFTDPQSSATNTAAATCTRAPFSSYRACVHGAGRVTVASQLARHAPLDAQQTLGLWVNDRGEGAKGERRSSRRRGVRRLRTRRPWAGEPYEGLALARRRGPGPVQGGCGGCLAVHGRANPAFGTPSHQTGQT